MIENRRKISLYNQHFAYINKKLFETFCVKKGITDINEYIKKKLKQEFQMTINSAEDVNELMLLFKENPYYETAADWLREIIRKDLKISRYNFYIDELICLSDIKTAEDIKEANSNGFQRVMFTSDEIKNRFPLLDVTKIFYNNTILGQMVYYDKDKYAMTEILAGFSMDKNSCTIENFSILTPPDFDKPEEMAVLMRIDYIYESYLKKDFAFFKFQNMPLYVNEIIDYAINDTTDKKTKAKLRAIQKENYY